MTWIRCGCAIQSPNGWVFSMKGPDMKTNVGGIDRILRIVIGAALVALAATGTVGLWGWIGIVPLATGLVGWCPPYALLGWSTCRVKSGA